MGECFLRKTKGGGAVRSKSDIYSLVVTLQSGTLLQLLQIAQIDLDDIQRDKYKKQNEIVGQKNISVSTPSKSK